AGLQDDDRVRVGRGDRVDQRVLVAGLAARRAVDRRAGLLHVLALAVGGEDDRDVGALGGLRGVGLVGAVVVGDRYVRAVSRRDCQSLITAPGKPHSPLRMSVSRWWCSQAQSSLTRL